MTQSQIPTQGLHVLVLAGSRRATDPVAEISQKSAKAFAEIGGRPMIEHVLSTLMAAQRFESIRVSISANLPVAEECPQLDQWFSSGDVVREEPAASPSQSVLQVLESIPQGSSLVVTTGDHPLLTVEMLTAFLDGFETGQAGAATALTSTDAIQERFPDMRRTALRLQDGNFSGCNLFAFDVPSGIPVVRFWRQLEDHRKKPLRMARILGITTLFRYQFKRLTLHGALSQLGRKTGVELQAVKLTDPLAGIDVDSPEDLRMVQQIFSEA